MLILGDAMFCEPDSGKSYIQLEYERAIDTGKRFFAVVLTEAAIDVKVKADGKAVIENEYPKNWKSSEVW